MKTPLQNILAAKAMHFISQSQTNGYSVTFSTVDGKTKARYTISLEIAAPKNDSLAAVAWWAIMNDGACKRDSQPVIAAIEHSAVSVQGLGG